MPLHLHYQSEYTDALGLQLSPCSVNIVLCLRCTSSDNYLTPELIVVHFAKCSLIHAQHVQPFLESWPTKPQRQNQSIKSKSLFINTCIFCFLFLFSVTIIQCFAIKLKLHIFNSVKITLHSYLFQYIDHSLYNFGSYLPIYG